MNEVINVEQRRAWTKKAVTDSRRELYGPVRIGKKKPKRNGEIKMINLQRRGN